MSRRTSRLIPLAVVAVLAATAPVLAHPAAAPKPSGHRALGLVANQLREAAFERAGRMNPINPEANRGAALDPATELVNDRAYPRTYVDDRLAVRDHKAYNRLSRQVQRNSFHSTRAFRAAQAFSPGTWSQLGPVTHQVSGYASQFFDPATNAAPTTDESGRQTALAVDPNCGKVTAPQGQPCRLWVAAAGGGIWRTDDALAATPTWIAPPADLKTNAFGSLIVDPTDPSGSTLYAGSGEPNGSSDSEAGLGLFKSTDGGVHWSQVAGSVPVATNRSIGAIAIGANGNIYIGTDVARHGSSSVNGGRRTPPNAPDLGVYVSTDNGATFTLETDLKGKTPVSPNTPDTSADWFQGGINKLELDPNNPTMLYAAVQGYGLWRADQATTPASATWTQVFHTMNQNDFSANSTNPGDTFGDRTEFDLVSLGATTRAYVGDASDDWVLDGDPSTPLPEVWRTNDVAGITGAADGTFNNTGWTQLTNQDDSTDGWAAYGYCQNGQCGYDSFVASPAGQLGVTNTPTTQDTLWLGGSMNYDELPAYQGTSTSQGTLSNGRAVIRSTNAGDSTVGNVTWQDMTATLGPQQTGQTEYPFTAGLHPDEHGIQFDPSNPDIAFESSDGGIYRIDVSTPQNASGQCDNRHYLDSNLDTVPLTDDANKLARCHELLSGIPNQISPMNDGLNTLQFQSVSVTPHAPFKTLLGGTQDNGTWQITTGTTTAQEVVGGDGGQSGFDAKNAAIRYHNYYTATPEVNFNSGDPTVWYDIYDTLQIAGEAASFYTPFIADPNVGGRLFTGQQHVWRSDDHGGDPTFLHDNGCNAAHLDPFRTAPCGDWQPIGPDLTSDVFGTSRDGAYVVALTRAPSNNNTLWAATRNGRVFVSTNAGGPEANVLFNRIDTASTPGRFVSGIVVDPANPNHAWVSYSGYNAYDDVNGHVFDVVYHPSTHKATFTNMSHNLGDQPITAIARDPATGDLYAGSDFGVLRLAHGASSWVKAGNGLPNVTVYGLTLAASSKKIYAATHGRGVYAVSLPGRPTGHITGPSKIQLGKKATFHGTGSSPNGGGVSLSWKLPGKPATASGGTAKFRATKFGRQTVTLVVTDKKYGIKTNITKSVKVVDTLGPTVHLTKPATVAAPGLTTISGTAKDPSGIASVRVNFGDGTFVDVTPNKHGKFSVKHRYPTAKTYTVKVTATDKRGNSRTAKTKATVT